MTIEPRKVLGFDASNGLCVRRSSCAQASFTGFLICSSNAVFCAGVRGRLPPVLARFPKFRIAPIATTSPRSTPFARAAKLPKKYSSSFFQSMLSVNNFIAPDTICVKRMSSNPLWSKMYSATVAANPARLPDLQDRLIRFLYIQRKIHLLSADTLNHFHPYRVQGRTSSHPNP